MNLRHPLGLRATRLIIAIQVALLALAALAVGAWALARGDAAIAQTPGTIAMPTGSVTPYAGGIIPDGYLAADGAAISRTTYAALFTAIGTTYGAGNGSTTFNVPDLRGRVAVGTGSDGSAANGANRTRGEKAGDTRQQDHNHTGTTNWMDRNWNHSHSVEGPGGHTHGPWGGGDPVVFRLAVEAIHVGSYGRIWAVGTDTNHLHSFTTNNTGGGGAGNMQPYTVTSYMIKT